MKPPRAAARVPVATVSDYPTRLARSLAACAPRTTSGKPRVAVLTPGIQDRLRSLATEPLLVPAAELPEWLVAEAARWRGMAEAIRLQAT